jgi:hypothetical protein
MLEGTKMPEMKNKGKDYFMKNGYKKNISPPCCLILFQDEEPGIRKGVHLDWFMDQYALP